MYKDFWNYLIHVLNLCLCPGRSKNSTEEYVNPTGAGPQKIQHVAASVGLLIVNYLVNCIKPLASISLPNQTNQGNRYSRSELHFFLRVK